MQSLRQRFRYVGPAWYRRQVDIPADWRGQDIILTLERVIWESRVWVNGGKLRISRQLSLTTPHRFDLTHELKPGQENTITLRIDNRGESAHRRAGPLLYGRDPNHLERRCRPDPVGRIAQRSHRAPAPASRPCAWRR